MPLFRATVTQDWALPNTRQMLTKGMELTFSSISVDPWSFNNGEDINNAFIRVFGIDLKANHAFNPGFVKVVQIG